MTRVPAKSFACATALGLSLLGTTPLRAQGVGTWVQQTKTGKPGMTMTVEMCCGDGRRLIYRVGDTVMMTVESKFDGSDAPVIIAGKPSGETMAIKRTDASHTSTILKMNGAVIGVSKAALSADGKTLTVENDMSGAKATEIWVKK